LIDQSAICSQSALRSPQSIIARFVRVFPIALAVIAICAYTLIQVRGWGTGAFSSDGYSYYAYLPAWLLHHDPSLDALARDCCGGRFLAYTHIRVWPATGRWIDPHPIGTAVMMSPFFVAAHALTRWSNLPPDGFSFYYQHFAALAGLVYMVLGVAILARLLSRYFNHGVVLATLITVVWGTNVFHYGTFDATFSHAYSFCLIAALLAVSDAWWREPRVSTSAGIGIVAGLIVLVRHTDALFLAIVPLYRASDLASAREAMRGLWERRRFLSISAVAAALVCAPQLVMYRQITGSWFISPYAQVGRFDFGSPHVAAVLFGVEKGLFFWSPALLIAVFGALVARGWARGLRAAAILLFVANTFLIASWSDWQFGGSFGHRGFTDGLPLAAVFFASAYEWASLRPRAKVWISGAATAAVALSVVQMFQYWMHVLPFANTTWEQYSAMFLRFK
jgi:hypothetical protein